MSRPEIQTKLLGRPARFADITGTLRNGRTIAAACRPVASPALSYSFRMFQPGRVCGNLKLSMSAGNASLGHACVSPASDADQKATGEFAGVRQPFSELGKGSADGRSR